MGTNTLACAPSKLLDQLSEVEQAWWAAWESERIADMIPRSRKWEKGCPDIRVGDIVTFLRDGKAAAVGKTPWRIGRVVEAELSEDGVIRTVVLEYRNVGEQPFRRTRRSVKSVALLEREEELDLPGQLGYTAKYSNILFAQR